MTLHRSSQSIRGLVGVLGAYAASLSANRLLSIAVPWFVYTTTGSAAKTGLIAFCQITPFVITQALSGPIIDRIGPRRISIVGDVVSMLAMAAATLLYGADALPLWALMALLALVGAADGPAVAAKAVFVPSVTRAARAPLERGTGLVTTVERSATVIGPLIAGIVVAAFGGVRALLFAGALFGLAALVTTLTLTDPKPDPSEHVHEPVGGYLAQFRQGASFLRREGLLRTIVAMLVATNFLDQAFMAVLLPAWVQRSGYEADTFGLIVSTFGATSIVASLVAAVYGDRLPRRAVYLIGFTVGGVPRFAVMALGFPLWAVVLTFAIGGLGSGFINPIIGAVSYERIPTPLLGRVRTLTSALSWSGMPFGGLFAAAIITASGLTGALWIVGSAYFVAIAIPGLRPEWSQMRRSTTDTPVQRLRPPAADGSPDPATPPNTTAKTTGSTDRTA